MIGRWRRGSREVAVARGNVLNRKPLLFLIGFGVLLALVQVVKIAVIGYAIGGDGLSYYAYLRSLCIDGDLHFANEWLEHNPFGHATPDPSARTATGHVPNSFFVGPALLWLPFFLLAHLLTHALALCGVPLEPDGYSALYQFFVPLGSIVYGLVGLALLHGIVARRVRPERAVVTTAAIALGTNVVYYLANEPAMSHPTSLFAVTLFVRLWLAGLDGVGPVRVRAALLLGCVGGLMVIVRPQNALFFVLPALSLGGVFGARPAQLREALLVGAGALLGTSPQLAAWHVIYGSFIVDSYSHISFDFAHPHLLDVLVSARHGLLSWTPIVLFALLGLLALGRRAPRLALALFACFVGQWIVNASWHYWWGGHAFGGRAFMNCSVVFAIGLASLLDAAGRARPLAHVALGLLVLWNLGFVAQYTMQMIPLDGPVAWDEVARNQLRLFGRALEILRGG